MPKDGMANLDLTSDGSNLPPDVAKALADGNADANAAGPGSEALLEEDVDEGNGADAAPDDAGGQEEDTDDGVVKTVPFQQFNRIYAEGKEAKKAAKALNDENERLKRQLAELESRGGTPRTQPQGKPRTAADIIEHVAKEAAAKAAAPLETLGKVSEAREMLDEFWAENNDPELVQHRKTVDKAVINGIKSGAYALEEIDPEVILATMVGRGMLNTRRATKAAATQSAKKVAAVNKNARTETGHRAGEAQKNTKKFSEKSVKEIEEEFGNVPIYRRRAPEDEDVDAD